VVLFKQQQRQTAARGCANIIWLKDAKGYPISSRFLLALAESECQLHSTDKLRDRYGTACPRLAFSDDRPRVKLRQEYTTASL